jgi:flagellar biosynthesis/type III secretory pathway M-ring protein FliF/YscJ
MLAAGVIDSILMIVRHVELLDFLKQLLLVLVLFLIIGHIVKLILDIGITKMADKEELFEDVMEADQSSVEHVDLDDEQE